MRRLWKRGEMDILGRVKQNKVGGKVRIFLKNVIDFLGGGLGSNGFDVVICDIGVWSLNPAMRTWEQNDTEESLFSKCADWIKGRSYTYNAILFSLRKEENSNTCYNTDEF